MDTEGKLIDRFLSFMGDAVSPYHSVKTIISRLTELGFKEISDTDLMQRKASLESGKGYVVHRNHSAVMSFIIPSKPNPNTGFTVCAGHTDSPCLRVRPESAINSNGFLQLGCELYGGGLWHTWFDRELGLAGKVVVREAGNTGDDHRLEERLVCINRPILLIPNLAIHLQSADERSAFKVGKETDLRPIVGKCPPEWLQSVETDSPPLIISVLAKEMSIDPSQIVDLDISLFDATPPRAWGISEEFIASGRIDNQLSNFCNMEAISQLDTSELEDVCCAVAFDHEEVGSRSFVGADSDLLPSWLAAIYESCKSSVVDFPKDSLEAIYRRSILVSTDGAHGVNPNYASKHQDQHKVKLGDGVVIKTNENQRYTTTGLSRAMAKEVCAPFNVKIQQFVVRNDSPCGSTIGPCLSSRLSMQSIDCGAPQWAMHSIRESCHIEDVIQLKKFSQAFFQNFRAVNQRITRL
eukprot:GHVH01016050.1.p1 GENE.GHVH01016050.1~~GHVH01016050.1.p1  ORF type:complete len:475 (-),score=53.49 GHVH01016050.1:2228-3625(-)